MTQIARTDDSPPRVVPREIRWTEPGTATRARAHSDTRRIGVRARLFFMLPPLVPLPFIALRAWLEGRLPRHTGALVMLPLLGIAGGFVLPWLIARLPRTVHVGPAGVRWSEGTRNGLCPFPQIQRCILRRIATDRGSFGAVEFSFVGGASRVFGLPAALTPDGLIVVLRQYNVTIVTDEDTVAGV